MSKKEKKEEKVEVAVGTKIEHTIEHKDGKEVLVTREDGKIVSEQEM